MKSFTIIWLMFVSLSVNAQGIDYQELNGYWTRVGDSCEKADSQTIENLVESGGGNGMNRRIALLLDLDNGSNHFDVTSFPSLQCEKGFKIAGIDFHDKVWDCDPVGTNEGYIDFNGNHIVLKATKVDFLNPWGTVYQDFTFSIENGVLIMVTTIDPQCPKEKYIYLIRTPAS